MFLLQILATKQYAWRSPTMKSQCWTPLLSKLISLTPREASAQRGLQICPSEIRQEGEPGQPEHLEWRHFCQCWLSRSGRPRVGQELITQGCSWVFSLSGWKPMKPRLYTSYERTLILWGTVTMNGKEETLWYIETLPAECWMLAVSQRQEIGGRFLPQMSCFHSELLWSGDVFNKEN